MISSAAALGAWMVQGFLLFAPLRLRRCQLLLVEVAIGLRCEIQNELVVAVLVCRLNLNVAQRDDARQRRNAADELSELVIAAGEPNLDGQLSVEVLFHFRSGLEELLFKASRE